MPHSAHHHTIPHTTHIYVIHSATQCTSLHIQYTSHIRPQRSRLPNISYTRNHSARAIIHTSRHTYTAAIARTYAHVPGKGKSFWNKS